jgi:nitrite reductase (cytochrome c-552)
LFWRRSSLAKRHNAAKQGSVDGRAMKEALALQRKAQWRVDSINADSMGFRAPQESARVRGEAIDYVRQGQIKVMSIK